MVTSFTFLTVKYGHLLLALEEVLLELTQGRVMFIELLLTPALVLVLVTLG